MLEFKPSLIAASALISAAGELFPMQSPAYSSAIFSSDFVNQVPFFLLFISLLFFPLFHIVPCDVIMYLFTFGKEKLKDCCLVMRDVLEMMTMDCCDRALRMASSRSTRATVLGGACPSSGSERTVGSSTNGPDLYKDPIEETARPSSLRCP